MIVVIADDLSGAAELAGCAVAHGLTAEVQLVFDPGTDADVVALCTDSRSCNRVESVRSVREAALVVAAARPDWVYKKTDSVLRGHVRAEIETIMRAFALHDAVLVSANPSRKRIVENGRYLIDGVPLHETAFADDPEYPVRSACVAEILGGTGHIRTPDAATSGDLAALATGLGPGTLATGAVDFFSALLDARANCPDTPDAYAQTQHAARTLFVCGSATAWRMGRGDDCAAHGVPVLPMPDSLLQSELDAAALEEWGGLIDETLAYAGCAMAAVARDGVDVLFPSSVLLERLSAVAASAIRRRAAQRVMIEGGATAIALIRAMQWTRLRVAEPSVSGLACLEPCGDVGIRLITKPGSYPWPESVWPAG
jgi:D-threonate/D-erythronate kinase